MTMGETVSRTENNKCTNICPLKYTKQNDNINGAIGNNKTQKRTEKIQKK